MAQTNKIVSAALLIMSTMVGTGMLGMPLAEGKSGFIPSCALLLFSWVYTFCASMLLLETCTWLPRGANFMTISRQLLGKHVALLFWVCYAIFFYCATTAHIVAAGEAIVGLSRHTVSNIVASILFTAFFGTFVYTSIQASSRLNRLLLLGLAFLCFFFTLTLIPRLNLDLLKEREWPRIFLAMDEFLYAFGFQIIIPPLYNYLECDVKAMKKAIWIGTTVSLFIFAIWMFLVLGIVPGSELGAVPLDSSIQPLDRFLNLRPTSAFVYEFIIISIGTSFLAMTVAFLDFWRDTLQWNKKNTHGLILFILVFAIPFVLAINYPTTFIRLLHFGGAFGTIIVFGIFPIILVWIGRYYRKYSLLTPELLRGGKTSLLLLLLASIGAIIGERFATHYFH